MSTGDDLEAQHAPSSTGPDAVAVPPNTRDDLEVLQVSSNSGPNVATVPRDYRGPSRYFWEPHHASSNSALNATTVPWDYRGPSRYFWEPRHASSNLGPNAVAVPRDYQGHSEYFWEPRHASSNSVPDATSMPWDYRDQVRRGIWEPRHASSNSGPDAATVPRDYQGQVNCRFWEPRHASSNSGPDATAMPWGNQRRNDALQEPLYVSFERGLDAATVLPDVGSHSAWVSQVRNALCDNQTMVDYQLDFCILKVPKNRRTPPEYFTPDGLRLGLHNRENQLDMTGLEGIKLSFAVAIGLVGSRWEHFCNHVVDDPRSLRQCYGLHEEATTLSEEEIKFVLALDALFLALFYDPTGILWCQQAKRSAFGDIVAWVKYSSWKSYQVLDLFKVENQIPFFLVEKTVEYLSNHASELRVNYLTRHEVSQYLENIMKLAVDAAMTCFMDVSAEGGFTAANSPQSTHVLGAAYEMICGPQGVERREESPEREYLHIPSAQQLKASGITIRPIHGPLKLTSYKDRCLTLPVMKMGDSMVAIVRNMAWYECYHVKNGCMFTDYVFLMSDLIQTPKDVELLIKCGVIDNGLGTMAFKRWSELDEGLKIVTSSKQHHSMKQALIKHCKYRRHKLWREFVALFCSRPWLALSAFTVFIVTVATLIQTYAAVIASKGMKPHFPP